MKPVAILLGVFVASLFAIYLATGEWDHSLSGRIAMAAMLTFTAIGHFAFTKGMTMMMPDLIPFKKEIVYLTGVLEVAAAVGLLIPQLPANINAALKRIDYQKGTRQMDPARVILVQSPVTSLFHSLGVVLCDQIALSGTPKHRTSYSLN